LEKKKKQNGGLHSAASSVARGGWGPSQTFGSKVRRRLDQTETAKERKVVLKLKKKNKVEKKGSGTGKRETKQQQKREERRFRLSIH